ncbi:hypothetical protein [Streptomyces sp. NPDC048639]|uniref:effector-associated constant component EACC1 n=1 Tax=Streptomyces sp. NPDC048639 TaxID=3365581 RepID=UPI003720BC10
MNALTFEFGGTAAEADALARDLAAWLDDDEDVAASARVRMVPPPSGEQGGLADAAELLGAVEPLLSAGIGAFGMWLAERARSRRISFRAVRPDGAELELSAGSRAEAEAVQERLELFVAGGSTNATGGTDGTSGAGGTDGTGGADATIGTGSGISTGISTGGTGGTGAEERPGQEPDRRATGSGRGATDQCRGATGSRRGATDQSRGATDPGRGATAPSRGATDPARGDNESRGSTG